MHSRIFQVSTEPIDKENYLNEDTLQQGDGSFYDYDTLCYNGGIEQWKEEYVANVKKKAEALTVDNMLEWSSTYYLKQAVENPLDVAYHFYLDGEGSSLLHLWSLSAVVNRELQLYIGGVIDYHF